MSIYDNKHQCLQTCKTVLLLYAAYTADFIECRQNFTTYYTERAYVTLRKRVIQNAFVQQALEHSSQPDPGQTTSSHLLPLLTAK